MKTLKRHIQENRKYKFRINRDTANLNFVDELVDEYLKPHFNKGQTVTFPSTKFSIKDSCAYTTIKNDVLHAILDDPNIENELNNFWQKMLKYKIYHFGYQDDMPKLWKEEAQYIYDFTQKINYNSELTNLYKSDNFTIDTFESNKYIFFKIHNISIIYIWIAEK